MQRAFSYRFIAAFGIFFCSFVRGQVVNFTSLTTENGLSNNTVLSIVQDRKGFIWLATGSGLNRYDGQHFKQYFSDKKDPGSLGSNYITALQCDRNGNLWIGTGSGIQLYNETEDNFCRIQIPSQRSQSRIISALYEDNAGNIWIGTFDGLFFINEKNIKKCVAYPYMNRLAGTNVRSIFQDKSSNLWIGTATGLTKICTVNGRQQFEAFHHDAKDPFSIPGNFITSLAETQDGKFLIGTQDNGVCEYLPENGRFKRLEGISPDEHIRKIFVRSSDDLWIGTQDGILNYSLKNKKAVKYTHNILTPNSLSQNSVYSIFQDNCGSLWIGTYYGGINVLNNYDTPFFDFASYFHVSNALFNDVISGMTEDKNGNLWIGTEGGGLHKVNLQNGTSATFLNNSADPESLGSNNVKIVYADDDGNIWIGTHGGGLNLYDPQKNKFDHYFLSPDKAESSFIEISSIVDDDKGHLWVGTHSGLYLFNRADKRLTPSNISISPALEHESIRTLQKDSHGHIWIGAASGTYIYNEASNKYSEITNYVAGSIAESSDGNIWVALSNYGLKVYNYKTKQLQPVATANNFGGKNIVNILIDNKTNTLWLSTDKGIIAYEPADHSYREFTRQDGLINENFNYNSFARLSSGEMLFGGIRGITVFQPDKFEVNKTISPIVFTELKLFDSTIKVGHSKHDILHENILNTKELDLKHNQNIFTISYALLNFIRSGKNRYAYKLSGFNQDWIRTNSTSATYTNVPPGKYIFEVKGANNDGIWSVPIKLTIYIAPPIWATWWAYAIYTIILFVIGFMVVRYFFLREILKKEEALHQNKLNFFTNISHEIRTHLTLITMPLEQIVDRDNLDKQDMQQINKVRKNSSRLLTLVNELMDFRKVESGNLNLYVSSYNIVELLEDIVASFEETAQERTIQMQIVYNNPDIRLYIDKNQMAKVFFNLLSNAFKYTQSGGKICVSIQEEPKEVVVHVQDNGAGIKEEFQDKIFNNFYQVADSKMQNTGYGVGLAMCKSIVELHKGTIEVKSITASQNSDGETHFSIHLQKGFGHLADIPYITLEKENIESKDHLIAAEVENKKNTVSPLDEQNEEGLPCVLIVEDNHDLQELLREAFAGACRLLQAYTGEEGLQMALKEIPDIVVSDVMMPKMDGFELCDALKKDEKTSHIPVILLTAKNTQTDHVKGLENGADIYLTKPFSTKVLLLSVKNALASQARIRKAIFEKITSPGIEIYPEKNSIPELGTVDKEFLTELIKIVGSNLNKEGFGVALLSKKIGMSPPILYKKLFAITGLTVNDFIKSQRMKRSAQLLIETKLSISDIADEAGFKDVKYHGKEFKKTFGMSPKEYRAKYTGYKNIPEDNN